MWEKIVAGIAKVNSAVNGVVWGWPMIILILGTGILITVRTKCMQVRKFGTSCGETIVPTIKSIGKKKKGLSKKENSISQFEAFATAISGTVGTGNIVGVTSAIMTGGPGAVCWMWVSAFFGMITNYAENVLGLYFRKRDKNGDFSGGPAYYLSEGLGRNRNDGLGTFLKTLGKILAVMAAVFCTFAAIGMSGVQTNKMSSTIQAVFTAPTEKQKLTVRTERLADATVPAILTVSEEARRMEEMMRMYAPDMPPMPTEAALILNTASPIISLCTRQRISPSS